MAIREDEDAAELMGVPTFKFKLWAFAIGAAIGGLSGALFAGQSGFINSRQLRAAELDPGRSRRWCSAAPATSAARSSAAFLVIYMPEWLRGIEVCSATPTRFDYRFARSSALVLIVMMIFRPQGLIPSRRRAPESRTARRRWSVE